MTTTARLRSVPRSEHVAKLIRFPPEMAHAVEKIAQQEDRTFQAQLLRIVREWMDAQPKAKK